jgi:hypothetical protein
MRVYGSLILLLLLGCAAPSAPDGWQRVVGWSDPTLSSVQAIKFPAEVTVNQPFTVTIITRGSSSCTRGDGAQAVVSQTVATVTPYDFVAPPNTSCTRDLHSFPREVSVTFTSVGPARLRLNTRRPDGVTSTHEWAIQVHAR